MKSLARRLAAVGRRLALGRGTVFQGLLKNSGWALAATAVTTAAGLLETVVLAHFLSPHGLGVFILLIAYPEAVQQLLDFRVRDGMTRYLAGFLAQGRRREAVAVVK
ncbi:MAG: hypothetical protein LC808_24160, partial [Actinobacteria bacterium]|nr:hypothetical protein [Actinomycetota bacterium]